MPKNVIQNVLALDCTDFATIITCTECAAWREIRSDRAAALAAGARHLKHVHGDFYAARRVQWLAQGRHTKG